MTKHKVLIHHYRVDNQFSNAFEKWKAIGKPQQVTTEQYQALENAGQPQLYTSPEWRDVSNGEVMAYAHCQILDLRGSLIFQERA